jgi:hypothetical protein
MSNPSINSNFVLPNGLSADKAQTLCPSNVPLVLFPVRLETRFFTLPDNTTELRVRIYPDKVHIDTHQPELTTDERTRGTQYWQQDWLAGNDNTARCNAWNTLASRFGAARAAWIARVLQPTNLPQRPTAPVPSGQSPAVAPQFPTLPPVGEGGESAWRHAPQARLLPDRWTAVMHSGGRVALSVTGKDILRPLAFGPDPQAPPPDQKTEAAILAGEQLALDPGMLWMVDFDAAEAAGMALRITIPPALLAPLGPGIDSLLVFGVAASLGAANTASQLADLLDAHHYTDGLEFLRYGTPTNNTDDRRAGYSSGDPGHIRSFNNEVLDPANAPNATRVGTALGLSSPRIALTLGRIGQGAQNHELDARSMNVGLWQVGWGYFLTNMIGPETGLTSASVDWARGHFVNYVRSGGPFPAIRCGSQPYGILPVTSLDQWAPGSNEAVTSEDSWVKGVLHNLRDNVWRLVANKVARIGMRTVLPDADLVDVMQIDAVSHSYMTRGVIGRHYLEHLDAITAHEFNQIPQDPNAVPPSLTTLLGLSTELPQPRLALGFLAPGTWPVTAPLVQTGEISPWRNLEPNYISTLLAQRGIVDIVRPRPNSTATANPTSLLQALLRHAMLREIANAAARIAATQTGYDLATLMRDVELVDLVDAPVVNFKVQTPPLTLHWKRQLDLKIPAITSSQTIGQFLEGLSTFTAPTVAQLGDFRTSLAHLQALDSESLQFLTQSTLDLSAHRLDAWITSFATKRLALMTAGARTGRYVGGYGWVENLKPAMVPPAVVPAAQMPPGEQAPLFAPPQDSGFIHAPSLTHASTAALLRNAHLGPTGIPHSDGPFAIDLSSRRVRAAIRLLEGLRQGQPLGALLGYQFERRLHDLHLDPFISSFRNVAPLAVRKRESNNSPLEAIAANNVVDGLVLLRRWEDPGDQSVTNVLQGAATDAGKQLTAELSALRDAVDGLADALTAEIAYQMVRGNTSRMGSALSAIAHGDAMPPELEVARIPRSGNSITHRVLMLMSSGPQTTAGWAGQSSSQLANTEPMLNSWLGGLLGVPSKVRCTVERLDDTTGAVAETHTFQLSELLLTPLDFVYGVEPVSAPSQQGLSLCYVEQLVLYQARRRSGGFTPQANLRLLHARPSDLAQGELTLFDLMEQARAIRRLLETARGVLPADISPPERPTQGVVDLHDLEGRIIGGENALKDAHQKLLTRVSPGTARSAEDLRAGMLALGAFGIGPAVPCVAVGETADIRSALLKQATALLKISAKRLDQTTELLKQTAATDNRRRCDQLFERGRAVFGARFVILPRFTCDAAGAAELKNALAASTDTQGGDPLAVYGWFTRCARVRDSMARFAACMRGSEVLLAGDRLTLSVAQLPFVADVKERWVGLPLLQGTELPASKLSLVVQSSVAINPAQELSGLMVDEWVEIVPNQNETTALAFQFDPPNSFAPQNVLIAVPPVPGQDWTTESLRQVLAETLDLAKLRSVDPSLLGAAAQYLPGLYLPFNVANDAVSTDFAPLTK